MYIYIYYRAYASSSSCDGKRACACAPKASAADARVRAEKRAAARGTGSGLPPARGSCNQRPVHVPRTPPVAVTAGAGLLADAANGPVGNIRVPNTSAGVEGATATGGAHGAAAGGQAAPPDDLAQGPAPFYRRLRRSPPHHVARCTSPCRDVAVSRLRLPPLGGSDGPRGLAAAAALPRARLYGQAARWVRFASCAPLVRRPSRRRCRDRCRNRRVAARRRAPAPAAGLSRRAPPGPQKA